MVVKQDISKTKEVIAGLKNENYSKIYIRTNEDLKSLFKCFSVKDKKVLTVLASSDQMFCSYYMGARSVDTFDVNKLQMYYHYLRKWLIEYRGDFSPSNREIRLSNEWIYNLLKITECKNVDEEIAYKYWYEYIMSTPGYFGKDLFRLESEVNRTMITDLEKLRDIISNKKLSFRLQNICGEIDKSQKYNTIILSNILEYNSHNRVNLEACRDNLYDILEDDGEVICTNLIDCYYSNMEKCIFKDKFELEDYPVYRENYGLNKVKFPVGYCYHKKRN